MDSTVLGKKRKLDTEDETALPPGAVFKKVKLEQEEDLQAAEPEIGDTEATPKKKKKKTKAAEAVEESPAPDDKFQNGDAPVHDGDEETPKKKKKKKSG